MKILLFIPFYNCEKQIGRVLKQVVPYADLFSNVLCVDNRSSDNSLKEAVAACERNKLKNVIVVRNNENFNLGGSHKVAFDFALRNQFEYLVVLHGDDQGQLSDIIPYIQSGDFQKYDCFLGARFHHESKLLGYSKFRTFGNVVLNAFCSLSVRHRVLDMGSGLNMYKTSFLKDARIRNFPDDLTFNVFLLFHSYFNKNSIKYFPLTWREEDQISNAKLFKQFKKIVILVVKTIFNPSSLYKTTSDRKYQYEIKYQN